MKSLILTSILLALTIYAKSFEGLYSNHGINNYPEVVLNLNNDSTFSYFLMNEFGYGTTLINRCGKYCITNGDTLILRTIILYDTIRFGDTAIVFNNKYIEFSKYLDIESKIFSSKPEMCIEFDTMMKFYYPDIRIYKNFNFKNELNFDKDNQVRFDCSKTSVFNYLNLRSAYFKIDLNLDSYYKSFDNKDRKNFLKISPRTNILNFRKDNFSFFAKYLINGNKLEFIDAIESDKYNFLSNPFTLTLQKVNK